MPDAVLDAPRPVQFDIRTPVNDDRLKRNIDHALSLGLPEADQSTIKSLRVIANGPSARRALLTGCETLALNGSLKLFTDVGLAPTYWAGCDPQPLMAQFLKSAPQDTIYFVASKCDPVVFETLQGHDVRLWHIDDTEIPYVRSVPTAVSVTLTALHLMTRLGYRHFDMWGWDGCYLNGLDHAVTQDHNDSETITVDVGPNAERRFQTTGSWTAEVNDAVQQLALADYQVTINGGGMIGEIMRVMRIPQAIIPKDNLRRAA